MELIIFDLDGTLIDSGGSILASIRYALTEIGRLDLMIDEKRALQQDLKQTLQEAYQATPPLTEKGYDLFVEKYRYHQLFYPHDIQPFPFVMEGLQQLKKDYPLAIATTKRTEQAIHILKTLQLRDYFEIIQGTDPGMQYKPAPDVLFEVMNKLKANPTRAAYVGDTVHDIKAAQVAGLKSIGVTYGYTGAEELKQQNPDHLIHCFSELTPILV